VAKISRNGQWSTHNDLSQDHFVARCALSVVLVFLMTLTGLHAAEPMMKTLSAHVVSVAADGASLEVDFYHPATEKIGRITFFVDGQTGLSGIDKLQELRSGQVVNIDYVEGEKNRLLIRRIARVKLSGPPAGLENFRGL
jgi:hypothetical protein